MGMLSFFQKHLSKIILLGLTLAFLLWKLPALLLHPNELLLTSDGDGLKSYYCFVYHLQFDETFLHFGGMNYPYGEHYLFTDGFPAIAWLIQLLPFLKPYGIGIVHLSLAVSLLFTPFFLYLILRKFQVNQWIAVLGALCLFILQPQFPRLFSHLSLSYSIFFPLSWYLLLQFKEKGATLKWTSLLLVNQLFWYFMHPYLGFMISVFYGVDWFVAQFNKSDSWKKRSWTLIPVVLPVVLVQLFLKLTDSIKDRPATPFGFFEYQAHWKSIFLPDAGPIHDWASNYLSFNEFRWEGYAYIGILTIAMLLVILVVLLWYFLKKSVRKITFPTPLFPAIFAAVFLLILSFGFPFNGNPHWLEQLTFLKQFRALGRFSWVFYYVIGVFGICVLQLLFHKVKNWESTHRFQFKSSLLISSLFVVQLCEGLTLLKIPTAFSKNLFDIDQLNEAERKLIYEAKSKRMNVKAILPLPWFHIGSEIYGKEVDPMTLRNSFLLSVHTGIPLYAVMLGRTSKLQTLDYFHVFNEQQRRRIQAYLPLFVYQHNGVNLYQEDEQKLADLASPYFSNSEGRLSVLCRSDLNKAKRLKKTLIWSDSFSDEQKWQGLIEGGRYRGKIEDYNTILRLDSSQLKPNVWYEMTFDYFPDWSKPIANVCYIEYVDPKCKAVNWFYNRSLGSFPGLFKEHIQVNIRFQAQAMPCEYHCFFIGKSTNVFFEVDNLKVYELNP